MTAVTKFMFDNVFETSIVQDKDDTSIQSISNTTHSNELVDAENMDDIEGNNLPEEAEFIGYSEAQLEEAKTEAFESGKLEGAKNSAETIETETLQILQIITNQMKEISKVQKKANDTLLEDGINISMAIIQKILPSLNDQAASVEVYSVVEQTLTQLLHEPRVIIQVNPETLPVLDTRIEELKSKIHCNGQIILKESPDMAKGDCHIQWGDGSSERNVANLWKAMEKIVNNNLELHSHLLLYLVIFL